MTSQASSLPSDPTHQDKRREKVKKILAIVAFVLLLGGNLFFVSGIFFALAFLCMGGDSIWFCDELFHRGLLLLTLLFLFVGVALMFRRRYWLAFIFMVWQALITTMMMIGIEARW